MDSTHDMLVNISIYGTFGVFAMHLSQHAYTTMTLVQMMALIIYVDIATFMDGTLGIFTKWVCQLSTDVLDDIMQQQKRK